MDYLLYLYLSVSDCESLSMYLFFLYVCIAESFICMTYMMLWSAGKTNLSSSNATFPCFSKLFTLILKKTGRPTLFVTRFDPVIGNFMNSVKLRVIECSIDSKVGRFLVHIHLSWENAWSNSECGLLFLVWEPLENMKTKMHLLKVVFGVGHKVCF